MTQGEWIFTFGYNHRDPVTGESLNNCYVAITASSYMQAREQMNASYGNGWAFQYNNRAAAKVEQYGLREVLFMTPEQIEEARLLHIVQKFIDDVARPLWVYRLAHALCPAGPERPPVLSAKEKSAIVRRRNAASEIRELIRRYSSATS